jgi:hypothetical protein
MSEFALGQPVPRFEDPRLLRNGGGCGARSAAWDRPFLPIFTERCIEAGAQRFERFLPFLPGYVDLAIIGD